MTIKKFLILGMIFVNLDGFAQDDCIDYKIHPNVNFIQPEWNKEVVQPLKKMDLLHGNVIATLVDNYDIVVDITNIEDGYCVALKSVDATIGYTDFLVQVDVRHKIESCSYNAILEHEDQHIRAYLSVIDELQNEIKNSVDNAANSITPVFVQDEKEIENIINKINNQLQSHPDLVLVKQKIKAAEEIKNKKVDMSETNSNLKKCEKI